MGQPSAPFSLNPEASFSIGISIGRHQLDISLIDFKCKILKQYSLRYDYPDVQIILKKIAKSLNIKQSQLAILWCLKNNNVSSVILGASNINQLKENLDSINFIKIVDSNIIQEINAI